MEYLSNLALSLFDLILRCLLPFLLIGVLLGMAGRKPEAALDVAFSLLGAVISGFINLLKLIFSSLTANQAKASSKSYPQRKSPKR